jgi:hypothetical protein
VTGAENVIKRDSVNQANPPTHTLAVKIDSVATNAAGNPMIKAFIDKVSPPNAQYPETLHLVAGTQVVVGETYFAELVQGNLKPNKDGKYRSDYYYDVKAWNVAEPEGPQEALGTNLVTPTAGPLVQPGVPDQYDRREATKNRSIQRQKAVEIASIVCGQGVSTEDLLAYATEVAAWIAQEPEVLRVSVEVPMEGQVA